MTTYNWIPDSFVEFQQAARQDRVELSILPKQYNWLYTNVLPFAMNKKYRYETRLLRQMVRDEGTFHKVHDSGVDLILYPEPHHKDPLVASYREEATLSLALTVVGFIAGIVLWTDGWHWLTIYILPAGIFWFGAALTNVRKDQSDQSGPWTAVLWAPAWPLVLALFFASGEWKKIGGR